jgi:hypothetical protein
MVDQRTIYSAAQYLLDKFGDRADDYATLIMHSRMEHDDVKRATVWLLICAPIDDVREAKCQTRLH